MASLVPEAQDGFWESLPVELPVPDYAGTHVWKDNLKEIAYINCDLDKFLRLQILKTHFSGGGFDEGRQKAVFDAGKSPFFINRGAVKLANLDFLAARLVELPPTFSFLDLAGGPGGFTQYLLWKFPQSRGTGITLRLSENDWNRKVTQDDRFTAWYGPDHSGDLFSVTDAWTELVHSKVDLVVADGGFAIIPEKLNHQETLCHRLIAVEVYTALAALQDGGVFILKMFDLMTLPSQQVLWLLAVVFDEVKLCKPVASKAANAEMYVVARGFQNRDYILQARAWLKQAWAPSVPSTGFLVDLGCGPPPESLARAIRAFNDRMVDLQTEAGVAILKAMVGKQPAETPPQTTQAVLLKRQALYQRWAIPFALSQTHGKKRKWQA
jgi:23S rRNA U2552 (ribose-2'-O)-methylase RlmE/FtsJ